MNKKSNINKKALLGISAVALIASGMIMAPAANANPYWHEVRQEQRLEHRAIERQIAQQRYYAEHPYLAPITHPFGWGW